MNHPTIPKRRHARACPGHPRLAAEKFVDGRVKPGHDGGVGGEGMGEAPP